MRANLKTPNERNLDRFDAALDDLEARVERVRRSFNGGEERRLALVAELGELRILGCLFEEFLLQREVGTLGRGKSGGRNGDAALQTLREVSCNGQ